MMPSTTDSPSARPHPITSSDTPTTRRIAEARTKEVSPVSKYLALPSVAAKKKLPLQHHLVLYRSKGFNQYAVLSHSQIKRREEEERRRRKERREEANQRG